MTKLRKRRNKQYQGDDAAGKVQKSVHHYTAVVRSPFSEWWIRNKRRNRFISIAAAITIFGGWLIIEAIRTIFFH